MLVSNIEYNHIVREVRHRLVTYVGRDTFHLLLRGSGAMCHYWKIFRVLERYSIWILTPIIAGIIQDANILSCILNRWMAYKMRHSMTAEIVTNLSHPAGEQHAIREQIIVIMLNTCKKN